MLAGNIAYETKSEKENWLKIVTKFGTLLFSLYENAASICDREKLGVGDRDKVRGMFLRVGRCHR